MAVPWPAGARSLGMPRPGARSGRASGPLFASPGSLYAARVIHGGAAGPDRHRAGRDNRERDGAMEPVIWEWVNLAVRWLHVIAGIAWIGSSFYFVHLD